MQSRFFWSVLFVMVVSLVACVPIEEGHSDREQADSHYMLGVSSLNEQNPTGALKEFLEAEKFDDRDDRIQAGLAQAYWLKQAHDLSEEHFLRAIALSDNDPQYYNNLAALYLSMERYDDAMNNDGYLSEMEPEDLLKESAALKAIVNHLPGIDAALLKNNAMHYARTRNRKFSRELFRVLKAAHEKNLYSQVKVKDNGL